MKRQIFTWTLVLMIALGVGFTSMAAEVPQVYLNDTEVLYKSAMGASYIDAQGTLMVPLEGFMQYYGTTVQDLPEDSGLKFTTDVFEMTFVPDEAYYTRNGFRIPLATQVVRNDKTLYVPLRSLVESLGERVVWDGEHYAAHVVTPEERLVAVRDELATMGPVQFSAKVVGQEIQFEWPDNPAVDYYILYRMSDAWEPQRVSYQIFPKSSSYYRPGYYDAATLDGKAAVYFKASAVIGGVASEMSEAVEVVLP